MDFVEETTRRGRTGSVVLSIAGFVLLLGLIFGPILTAGQSVFGSGVLQSIFGGMPKK